MMSARIILLVCVFVCHRATATSQPKARSQPTCRYNNQNYKVGPIPTNDPCETCRCPPGGGDPECEWQGCMGCSENEDYVDIPGQCCWECRPRPTTTTPPPPPPPPEVCEYNGKQYEPGPLPTSSLCETCWCPPGGGDPECEWQCCDGCTEDEDYVDIPGQCCWECRPRPTTTPPTPDSDNSRQISEP